MLTVILAGVVTLFVIVVMLVHLHLLFRLQVVRPLGLVGLLAVPALLTVQPAGPARRLMVPGPALAPYLAAAARELAPAHRAAELAQVRPRLATLNVVRSTAGGAHVRLAAVVAPGLVLIHLHPAAVRIVQVELPVILNAVRSMAAGALVRLLVASAQEPVIIRLRLAGVWAVQDQPLAQFGHIAGLPAITALAAVAADRVQ